MLQQQGRPTLGRHSDLRSVCRILAEERTSRAYFSLAQRTCAGAGGAHAPPGRVRERLVRTESDGPLFLPRFARKLIVLL